MSTRLRSSAQISLPISLHSKFFHQARTIAALINHTFGDLRQPHFFWVTTAQNAQLVVLFECNSAWPLPHSIDAVQPTAGEHGLDGHFVKFIASFPVLDI